MSNTQTCEFCDNCYLDHMQLSLSDGEWHEKYKCRLDRKGFHYPDGSCQEFSNEEKED